MKSKWWQGRDGKGPSVVMVAATMVTAGMLLAIFFFAFSIYTTPGCSCIPARDLHVDVQRVNETAIYVKIVNGSDIANLVHSEAPGRGCINVTSIETGVYPNYVDTGGLICTDSAGSMQYFAVPAGTNVTVMANYKDGWQQEVWYGKI